MARVKRLIFIYISITLFFTSYANAFQSFTIDVSKGSLKFRKGPCSSAGELYPLKKGETVVYLENDKVPNKSCSVKNKDYMPVRNSEGKIGFVHREYIKKNSTPNVTEQNIFKNSDCKKNLCLTEAYERYQSMLRGECLDYKSYDGLTKDFDKESFIKLSPENKRIYMIAAFLPMSLMLQETSGFPASVSLAQTLKESGYGTGGGINKNSYDKSRNVNNFHGLSFFKSAPSFGKQNGYGKYHKCKTFSGYRHKYADFEYFDQYGVFKRESIGISKKDYIERPNNENHKCHKYYYYTFESPFDSFYTYAQFIKSGTYANRLSKIRKPITGFSSNNKISRVVGNEINPGYGPISFDEACLVLQGPVGSSHNYASTKSGARDPNYCRGLRGVINKNNIDKSDQMGFCKSVNLPISPGSVQEGDANTGEIIVE